MIKTTKLVEAQKKVLLAGGKLIQAQHDFNEEIRLEVIELTAKVRDNRQMGLIDAKQYYRDMARIYREAEEASVEISYEIGETGKELK